MNKYNEIPDAISVMHSGGVFQNYMHQELRSGRGIEVESPKCEGFGVDGLGTESPVAIALRFGHAP
jgi:hypothetical protein